MAKAGIEPRSPTLEADTLTTRSTRQSSVGVLGIIPQYGARIAQSVMCWALWCGVAGLNFLCASNRGDFSLGVNMIYGSISPKLFRMITSIDWDLSSPCTHAFHRRLKRSLHSCPRRVNSSKKPKPKQSTPSMHHPRRWNMTISVVGLKTWSHVYAKISPRMLNPRDIAGKAEEEDPSLQP